MLTPLGGEASAPSSSRRSPTLTQPLWAPPSSPGHPAAFCPCGSDTPGTSCKWIPVAFVLLGQAFPLGRMSSRSPRGQSPPLLRLNNIRGLMDTICLSVHRLRHLRRHRPLAAGNHCYGSGVPAVRSVGHLPRGEPPDHAVLVLSFRGTSARLSATAAPFYPPDPSSVQGPSFPRPHRHSDSLGLGRATLMGVGAFAPLC